LISARIISQHQLRRRESGSLAEFSSRYFFVLGNANAVMLSSCVGASKNPPPVEVITTYWRPSRPWYVLGVACAAAPGPHCPSSCPVDKLFFLIKIIFFAVFAVKGLRQHCRQSMRTPMNLARPSAVSTHSRFCHGGSCRMCCECPHSKSATQCPSSSW